MFCILHCLDGRPCSSVIVSDRNKSLFEHWYPQEGSIFLQSQTMCMRSVWRRSKTFREKTLCTNMQTDGDLPTRAGPCSLRVLLWSLQSVLCKCAKSLSPSSHTSNSFKHWRMEGGWSMSRMTMPPRKLRRDSHMNMASRRKSGGCGRSQCLRTSTNHIFACCCKRQRAAFRYRTSQRAAPTQTC